MLLEGSGDLENGSWVDCDSASALGFDANLCRSDSFHSPDLAHGPHTRRTGFELCAHSAFYESQDHTLGIFIPFSGAAHSLVRVSNLPTSHRTHSLLAHNDDFKDTGGTPKNDTLSHNRRSFPLSSFHSLV